MSFLKRVLEAPSYGFERGGALYVPSTGELLREFLSHLNVFHTRKNWLAWYGWTTSSLLAIPLVVFAIYHFTWPLLLVGFLYGMVALGSHGTMWLHRYSTHRAFTFANPVARFIARNLVVKIVPEEAYVVSHHVHHLISEQPGDPYNVHGGGLYCFLADANHQGIRRDFDATEYAQVTKLVRHTGMYVNTHAQYQFWGSLCHPVPTVLHYVLSWVFWYSVFWAIGGHPLATALFGGACVWAFGVRTFNFGGHGGGKDKRQDGIDFNREDLSVNQVWPGYVAGEWHNNHHLYPNGARSGFLPYQLDLPWLFIRFYTMIGGINTFRDYKDAFYADHYEPWLASQGEQAAK